MSNVHTLNDIKDREGGSYKNLVIGWIVHMSKSSKKIRSVPNLTLRLMILVKS